jgi:hypothetical protein
MNGNPQQIDDEMFARLQLSPVWEAVNARRRANVCLTLTVSFLHNTLLSNHITTSRPRADPTLILFYTDLRFIRRGLNDAPSLPTMGLTTRAVPSAPSLSTAPANVTFDSLAL